MTRDPAPWTTMAGGMIMLAGIIHLLVAPPHLAEARGAGLFFLALGGAQVLWGLLYLRHPERRLERIGLSVLALAPALLFIITRVWRAPFADGPEGLDTMGLVALTLQLAGAALLLRGWRPGRRHLRRAVAIGSAVALVLYAGAVAAEDVHILEEPEGPHGHDPDTVPIDEPTHEMSSDAPNGTHEDSEHGH